MYGDEMDISINMNNYELSHYDVLSDVHTAMMSSGYQQSDFTLKMCLKGWMLKIRDQVTKFEIRVMINRLIDIHSCGLILQYHQLDDRFTKTLLFLKLWNA